ncbi:PAS domain S-box protein [Flavobacterium sp. HXWNR69]|uniref:histidine kinase n=1 Tax=Flavobacterium fragile TaxID=2949085 RepID=A0ABT0TDP9_9FLAO|nr:PAS domain-containing protein [Flavobacterium sp. HXWNR69]MCL9769032.1 PAS domain S-box protein [Flavobacterium sp. HXWNR69]
MKLLLKGISEANNFLLKEKNIHDALQNCITALGQNINVDRCYIFQNEIVEGELILNYEYEWCNKNTEPFIGNPELSGHNYDTLPGLYIPLSQNLPVYGLVKDSSNRLFKEVMEMQNIKAYLFTPIFSDGFFWGWIGFDDCENERIWTEDVVSTLHTVAHNIGLRLSQDTVTSKLENTLFELDFYMKSSKQAKWEWNIKTNQVIFSYNWFGMLGYEDDELEHSVATWESLLHPEDKLRIKQKVNDYINNKIEQYEGITRIRSKSGNYVWVKYSALKILDNDGNVEKIIGTHIDINDIKEKELELANQRNEYDHLINNLAEIIFKTDLKGNLFFLNDQWEKITEHSIETCLGTSIFNYFENFNIDEVKELLLHPISKEVQLIKKNKEHIWGLIQLNIDFDISSQKKIIIGSITDINDTINFKNKLEISEQKYKFIAENTSDLIMQHLIDGTITYVSQNSEKITGYKPEELIDQNPYNYYHPEDIEIISKQHQNILNNKNEIVTFRFKKKNGKYIWLETYSKTLFDEKNNIIGLQTSSRDITKRVKDKENVEKALEREKELNELKSGFVSMVSHQFRTPLSVIYSNLELLNFRIAKIEDEKRSEIDLIKNRIHNEVNRMTELMNNILIYGAFESNNLKIDLKEFHLNTFVENLIDTYFFNEIDGRKIIFESEDYQPLIESDESLLTHILNNLISNSFKYSIGSSNPIIRISYLEKRFKIEVIDFGIGIPENEIKHMFQSFFRGSNTSTIKGSGLGLIIAKQFTELLNGTISMISKENEITIVTLEFPYKQNLRSLN